MKAYTPIAMKLKKLWDEILNNKKFLFPVNLHILSFIDHHKPNLKLTLNI